MSDMISRQAAIDAVKTMFAPTPTQKDMVEDCLKILKNLPPVTPHPKYEEDIAKAFQLGLAFGFGEKYDEMDRVIDEIKKVITQG